MELVIDANVVISALIAAYGKTFDIVFNERIKLFAPEFLLEEIEKYKRDIILKSGLTDAEFELFLSLISARINFVPYEELKSFISDAQNITPDINDTEYFALALRLKGQIWSNDKRLKNQNKVRVYNTNEVLKLLTN